MPQSIEQKAFKVLPNPKSDEVFPRSFTILPKSDKVLPQSFKILPKSDETDLFEETNKISDDMHIKEAHQSFVVLGETKISKHDAFEEDIPDSSCTTSSKYTISEDDLKEDEKIVKMPRRLLPLRALGDTFQKTPRLYNRNNGFHQPNSNRKVRFFLVKLKINTFHL